MISTLAAALNSASIQLLPSTLAISQEHQRTGQQPDNLCGPYWVGVLLRRYGLTVTAEEIAEAAGSVLPIGDPQTWLPRGAQSRQDYCLPIPMTDCMRDAGTSAQGLVQAIADLSDHDYSLVPLQARWSADRLMALLNLCREHPEWDAVLLCNLRTGHLWGSGLPVSDAIAFYRATERSRKPKQQQQTMERVFQVDSDRLLSIGDRFFFWRGRSLLFGGISQQ